MCKVLSTDDCLVLRGLAIMSIVMHNYCHILPNVAHENEFYFSEEHNLYFWQHFFSTDFIFHLFSYFGHLGVPVFVFLTGYGLMSKYGGNSGVGVWSFIWAHYKKFLFPMLFGMIAYLFFYGLIYSTLWEGWVQSLLAQLSLTNTFVFHPDWFIKPGPYWYFGMTMQLYIIYRLLVHNHSKSFFLVFVLLSFVGLILLESKHYSIIWFKYNSLGWLLPFAIGLYIKKDICFKIKNWQWLLLLVCSATLIPLMFFNFYLWLLVPVVTLLFYFSLCRLMKGWCYKTFKFIGSLSMYVFVIHPIVREVVVNTFSSEYLYGGLIVYIIITILCAWLVSHFSKVFSLKR